MLASLAHCMHHASTNNARNYAAAQDGKRTHLYVVPPSSQPSSPAPTTISARAPCLLGGAPWRQSACGGPYGGPEQSDAELTFFSCFFSFFLARCSSFSAASAAALSTTLTPASILMPNFGHVLSTSTREHGCKGAFCALLQPLANAIGAVLAANRSLPRKGPALDR